MLRRVVTFQSKIRELEEKLGEERHHRRLMVEKSSEVIHQSLLPRVALGGPCLSKVSPLNPSLQAVLDYYIIFYLLTHSVLRLFYWFLLVGYWSPITYTLLYT